MKVRKFGVEYILYPMHDLGYVNRKGGLFSKTGDKWISDLESAKYEFDMLTNDNNTERTNNE
jgi:hypothetical protein